MRDQKIINFDSDYVLPVGFWTSPSLTLSILTGETVLAVLLHCLTFFSQQKPLP